ncbi:LemA family protein [Muribaculaceae bacterium Isolate-039 (Harlan)]|uniref:LemA family protein n=3 Tax=Muribaculaceae TaxID=2005473 RepID=A0A2V1IKW1_9BACT|nr:LemA family protein [Muribaculaceae bacterium S4]NBI20979.1 LemA family protein [Muribaculaceae bacterium Z1]PWB03014.1 LemA family protein [Duncaniella muris]QCD38961.1 LemA family protein [Duncaniella sp. C9]QCP72651.1 LemA family protein [Duncaniella sp. B8]ROS90940.1 LemA family protein [Muribaculaceae bacterium Isolate-039 (Harlan)]ROS96932.1 LemA family protein [Muribaculaceae bacterium Isolate-083 (Janvier)]ROS98103.1 LemA family protein [Muribaculaceae bacterium Isolate-077 (Janvi
MKFLKHLILAVMMMPLFSSCNYNSLVEKNQQVEQSWAEVQNQYQRRSDLIPNLVATVKGYATHESETLEKVTQARAAATSVNINAEELNEETLAKFQEAQNQLTGALKSLLAVSEAYPDLKANENFRDLQVQLEGTENRIATARGRYTQTVADYNTSIKKFPTNIYAGWFGFEPQPQFKADDAAQRAPEVKF